MSSIFGAKTNVLLTGDPGCGKTTLIKDVISVVGKSAGGFYTDEIRERGIRQGFNIVTLNGVKVILSHVDFKHSYRVSKYIVDVNALETVAAPAVMRAIEIRDIIIIDEIGKMELFSSAFQDAVEQALDSPKKVLGTIMRAASPFADAIKRRDDVEIITLSRANRDAVHANVLSWLQA